VVLHSVLALALALVEMYNLFVDVAISTIAMCQLRVMCIVTPISKLLRCFHAVGQESFTCTSPVYLALIKVHSVLWVIFEGMRGYFRRECAQCGEV
jgi:hypothetical protein